MSQINLFPLPFWLTLVALVIVAVTSWRQRESSLRVPMWMVLITVVVWYIVDVFYNDYSEYLDEMGGFPLACAWWEVFLFLCAFGVLAPMVHRWLNRKLLGKPSNLLSLVYYGGVESEKFQDQLDVICRFLLGIWIVMMTIALARIEFDFQGLFMPYLGVKVDPWARGRLGGGYDALLAAAGYLQVALTAAFGVIVALSFRTSTFSIALIVSLLTLPGYIFDRTRSTILATILPGFFAWILLRLRAGFVIRLVVLVLGFLVVQGWFKFVIANRGEMSIAAAIYHEGPSENDNGETKKHFGLNMFEELGFVNSYFLDGTYRPNWGENYFAELVNPIPRVIWPGKPMIGIDYAIARGQKLDDETVAQAGVGATISTGMIGQGVLNFGRILGPVFAALLMAFWTAILARQDLLAAEPGRLFLYAIGLILTFNMGRDITLLVVYPFCFGYLLLLATKSWANFSQARPRREIGRTSTLTNAKPGNRR